MLEEESSELSQSSSKASSQPYLLVCKLEVLVLRAKRVDLINEVVHAAVVEVQAPVHPSLPLDGIVGEGGPLQYWQIEMLSPWVRTRHDSTIIVKTPNCPSIQAIRIPSAKSFETRGLALMI